MDNYIKLSQLQIALKEFTKTNIDNNNTTQRLVSGQTYNLSNDAESHLISVSRAAGVSFPYDPGGQIIRATITSGSDAVFFGNYFEWNVATQTKRTYYYAGATRIAMREGSTDPQWILGDHTVFAGAGPGSTSKMVSYLGADTGGQWYRAWGETRLQTGAIPTKYQYTGQYNQVIIGLYFYNSRWYDPNLGRFTQPDVLIPELRNSQAWDRYSYVLNNPLRLVDPTGHSYKDEQKHKPPKATMPLIDWGDLEIRSWLLMQLKQYSWYVAEDFITKEIGAIYETAMAIIARTSLDQFLSKLSNITFTHGNIRGQSWAVNSNEIHLSGDWMTESPIDDPKLKALDAIYTLAHELGHIIDYRSKPNGCYAVECGGGEADNFLKALGGDPRGTRFLNGTEGIPSEFKYNEYTTSWYVSTADYFATSFAIFVFWPSKMNDKPRSYFESFFGFPVIPSPTSPGVGKS